MRFSTPGRSSRSRRFFERAEGYFYQSAFWFLLVKALVSVVAYLILVSWFPDKLGYRNHTWVCLAVLYTFFGVWSFQSSKDSRVQLFGVFLMCTAAAYSSSNILLLASAVPNFKSLAEILVRTRFEIFLPWFLWRFVGLFPGPYERPSFSVIRRAFQTGTLILGSFYFFLGIIDFTITIFDVWKGDFAVFVWHLSDTAWYPIMMLAVASMVAVFVKTRETVGEERRRSSLFAYSLLLGFGVQSAYNTLETLSPAFQAFTRSEPWSKVEFFGLSFCMSLMPFTSFYAVISNRVMDIQQIARSAVQYLLARVSATAIGLTPFVLLVALLVQNRDQALAELFSGLQAIVLTGLTVMGVVLMRFRRMIMDAIDRRFFRDRYNARLVLTELAEQVRGTRTLDELSTLIARGVDLALHLERVTLLALDSAHGRYTDPLDVVRPLDSASKLATLLQGSREPLVVDLDDPRSPLRDLDDREKHWLIDGQVGLLSPAYALEGEMIGILALGRKRSDEPFVNEDKDLVKGVCSSAGLVIELLQLKERAPTSEGGRVATTPPPSAESDPADAPIEVELAARECLSCTRVYPSTEERCATCGVELEATVVPYVLRGQYRFESRLGTGGMAVVYRATDLRLGREVAIKTLPRVSPEAAMRLHREARTAATVSDPGLAAIYGIETWKGMPLLIQEYLKGGTLSDQLLSGEPLDPLLAVDMGKTVALALHKIHSAGILHRDLKPSNIGYTQDGHAKLLDFGVARIHHDLRQDAEVDVAEPADGKSWTQNTATWVIGHTATGQLVGTIGYLSPEAVMGHRPEPSVDLWALGVVLWESLAGVNLFTGRSFQQVLERIRDVKVARLRDHLPDCPPPVEEFFAAELHPDKMKRARTGREMYERLEALRLQLLG